jgi:antitoxin Phd
MTATERSPAKNVGLVRDSCGTCSQWRHLVLLGVASRTAAATYRLPLTAIGHGSSACDESSIYVTRTRNLDPESRMTENDLCLDRLDREVQMKWQVQEAKQRFSELVQKAIDEGPQVVTRRGEEAVVVLGIDEYRRLTGRVPDFKEFLLSGPDITELQLDRNERDFPRDVEL